MFLWHTGIPPAHSTLNISGAGNGIHHAWEFDQHPIPGQLDNASLVLRYFRVNQFRAQRFKCSQRGRLVLAHEPAVSDYIGGKNGGEAALHINLVTLQKSTRERNTKMPQRWR